MLQQDLGMLGIAVSLNNAHVVQVVHLNMEQLSSFSLGLGVIF